MPQLTEWRYCRAGVVAALAAAICLAWPFLPPSPAAAAPFGVPDETAAALVAELGERHEVITLSRGYVLRPRAAAGFELVELAAEGVLVDGERYDSGELRAVLGDDAELVLALTGDAAALANLAKRRAEQQRAAARELEESRRQAAERERRERELGDKLDRQRRQRSQVVRTETRVALGSGLTIEDDESARDVVVLLGPLDVRGEVRGDTVVVLGSAEVAGKMDGDLTVVGGNVSLGPDASVGGEVLCVGGVVRRAPGSEVDGEVSEVSFAPLAFDTSWLRFEGWQPLRGRGFRWFDFVGSVFNTIFLAVLILLTVLVARRRVSAVADRVDAEPWKSGLIGLVIEVLIAPVLFLVSLLLVISIVGIPVLVVLLPFAVLLLLVVFFLGYAGVAVALGRSLIGGRVDLRRVSPVAAVLIGLVLIQCWQIFGEGLTFAGGLIRLSGYLLIALGFLLKYLAWTVGLGAVVLDRFSRRPALEAPYVPTSLPPLPDLPDEPAAAGPAVGYGGTGIPEIGPEAPPASSADDVYMEAGAPEEAAEEDAAAEEDDGAESTAPKQTAEEPASEDDVYMQAGTKEEAADKEDSAGKKGDGGAKTSSD